MLDNPVAPEERAALMREALQEREYDRQTDAEEKFMSGNDGTAPIVHENLRGNNPDNGKYTKLNKKFTSATEAAQWLAKNGKSAFVRFVAAKIAPHLDGVSFKVVEDLSTAPFYIRPVFADDGIGASALHDSGKREIFINGTKENGNTEENVLHELVHAATQRLMKDDKAAEAFRKLAAEVKFALGTWEGQYPINDTEKARIAKFFSNRFKSPEEFVAYVFSSPTMQDVMKLLGADGKWLTPRDEQGKRSINKNAGAVRRTLEPVPKYSLLDKFCDLVRSLLGLPKVYKERLDAVIRRNQEAVIENKRAATYVPKTLDERVHELLTDLLATDSAVQNNAAPAKRESRTDNGERNIPDVRLNIDSVATHHALDTRIEQLTGPSGLQAYTTAESAVKKAFKSFMSLHDLVTEYGKVLPSAAEWYKSVRATIATRTKLEADAVNRMQSAISLT